MRLIPVEKFYAGIFIFLFAATCAATCQAACPPEGMGSKEMLALKENKFEAPAGRDLQKLALAMSACLADKNPLIRDDIAFSALQNWMRTKKLSKATVHELYEILLKNLSGQRNDKDGFLKPFSALAMAEVARYDRNDAMLSRQERMTLVTTAAAYMDGIRDYRGFDAKQGYRHAVAHTADLMLQLSLNTELEKPQLDQLLAAIGNKITATGGHFYIYGEPGRLMAPVFYIAKRKLHSREEWKIWFAGIASPKPEDSWTQAMTSQAGWAHKNNSEAFLLTMYVNVSESGNKEVQGLLLPGITAALHEMP